jgi:uncharacterized protein
MKRAFDYGKIINEFHFTNRTKEIDYLVKYLKSGINCTIIAPRRWGKSSLVQQVANKMASSKIKFCFIDLFNIRTERDFINVYSTAILKGTSSSSEEVIRTVKQFIKNIIPEISFSPDSISEFQLSFNIEDAKKKLSEILDLPNKIAKEKGIQVVICIDEFQNLSFFDDNTQSWQKTLRAHWQKHQNCNYLLYGSRKHLMLDFFTKQSMPFYQFGEILFLQKIENKHWVPYITGRFKETKKKISEEIALQIAETMEQHPYFVQKFAMAVWLNTANIATKANFENALDDILNEYNLFYDGIAADLSNPQLGFLKAIINKVSNFSSKLTIENYALGSSANVVRIKEALDKKEIIDIQGSNIIINDPLFALWLKRRYFALN